MKRFIFFSALVGLLQILANAEIIRAPYFIPTIEVETPVVIDTISLSKLDLVGNIESVFEITYIVRNDGGSIKYIRPAHFEHNSSDEKNEGVFELDEKFRSTNFGAIFNPNGFIKEYALLWPNLEPKEINEYDYSRNNRLIKHSQFLYFSDATISNIYTFTYPGSSMNPTLIERTHDGHSADKTIIEYNYRKQPVKISTIDYNGETESKIYHYSDCGLIFHKETGDLASSVSFVYNSECMITEERNTWGDDLYFTTYYEYDDGNITKITSLRNGEPSYSKKFSYTDGRLYSILYNQPNRGFEYTETYDYVGSTVTISRISTDGNSKIKYDNGRLILIERNNNTFTYQYEFDNHGNWIEIVEFKNGIPRYGRKRVIKYID